LKIYQRGSEAANIGVNNVEFSGDGNGPHLTLPAYYLKKKKTIRIAYSIKYNYTGH
jgi:hypothetical protein